MTSIEEIHSFLFNPSSQPSGLKFFQPKYPDDLYIRRVGILKEQVLSLYTCQQTIIISPLEQIVVTDVMKGLISVIKKTLTHPRVFLFADSVNLFRQVSDFDLLKRVITHLERLPIQPPATDPRPGSFDAVKPLDDDHDVCLRLLRNNALVYDQFEECVDANIFLQKLLFVYQATHTESIETPSRVMREANYCTIL
jgi:hypothetical protein